MNKQHIFIINNNSLYEILDEVKELLSFKIIKYNSDEEFINDYNPSRNNSLIITASNKKLTSEKKFSEKNFLVFKSLPLSINKLIETINIQLIKLKFNHQSKINIKDYTLNLNAKFFSKDNIVLKLTEKEIEIILYLNETKTTHNVLDLQKNIWGYSPDMETHTVETHIYRLRKKISDKFNDEKFILSHQDGYFISKNKN
tara:strand:+ start:406 stop:1005 length:600 start_codon:yes stop_codon:yes gene_type:complete